MSKEFLSQLVHYRTYSKYLPEKHRRESIEETITRNADMHKRRFPAFAKEIDVAYTDVIARRVVPSMRAMQFAGNAIERRHQRIYNCAFLNITSFLDIRDMFMMSMSGTGVGYSVKKRHVGQLPVITEGVIVPSFVISDSAEGWADSILFLLSNPDIQFDYSHIRPSGEALSSGGTASGPRALMHMHGAVRHILRKTINRKLTSFEVHRICCLIADCVVVGGVRRSALICLFDSDDTELLNCKNTGWGDKYPELARSNNSAVIRKDDPEAKEKASAVIQACFDGGQAEPGLSWTMEDDWGFNPCHEIALRSYGVCNLTEVNVSRCLSKEQFLKAIESATIIGTLQASYTDFKGVQPMWKHNAEADALLGVSLTGQAENIQILTPDNLREGALLSIQVNRDWAKKLRVNPAKRITTTKPSGTASSWLGTTAGVHAGHEIRYLRRVRIDRETALGKALSKHFAEFVANDQHTPSNIIMQVPIKLHDTVLLRNQENALQCLERVKLLNKHWILPGHLEGANTHNTSLTINYHEHEKEAIKDWMLNNKESYYGISLIPYDGGDYAYLPYSRPVEKELFEILEKRFNTIHEAFSFDDILEKKDNTAPQAEAACAGGVCTLEL